MTASDGGVSRGAGDERKSLAPLASLQHTVRCQECGWATEMGSANAGVLHASGCPVCGHDALAVWPPLPRSGVLSDG